MILACHIADPLDTDFVTIVVCLVVIVCVGVWAWASELDRRADQVPPHLATCASCRCRHVGADR